MFERRPDATLVRDLPPIRRFMPFLSPRRNESLVYFAHDVDVEAALRFVEAHAEERPPDRPLTLFHLILRGLVRVLQLPDIKEKLTSQGTDPVANSPQDTAKWFSAEHARMAKLIKDTGFKLE